MGSDEAKIEKKRLKAQVKAEKARSKAGLSETDISTEPSPKLSPEPAPKPEKTSWYKDPHWVRAIIAIATLVVMMITLIIALQ